MKQKKCLKFSKKKKEFKTSQNFPQHTKKAQEKLISTLNLTILIPFSSTISHQNQQHLKVQKNYIESLITQIMRIPHKTKNMKKVNSFSKNFQKATIR